MLKGIYHYIKGLSITKRILLIAVIFLVIAYFFSLPSNLFDEPYSTVVQDSNGVLLGARIADDGQWRFPQRDSVPEKLEECILEFEDRCFYYHFGFNPASLCRAAWQNIKHKRVVSGGSTITMQTIRLSRQKPRTLYQKIVEIILATRLEFRASKREILSMYISHAPFGGNVVGVDAASWRYLGHSADDLSWAESAMLAVLPNSPSMIHLAKGREQLKIKRDRLLKRLMQSGKIDTLTYELAVDEALPTEPHALPQLAPHVVDKFYREENGKKVTTTINADLQMLVSQLAHRWSGELSKSNIFNLAIIVIDLPANEVIAYCGNVNYEGNRFGNKVDLIQARRSSGSIFKPFLYNAMLEEGDILPNTLIPDIPINISGYAPENFSKKYLGAVPASKALAMSLNIPAVVMLKRYDVTKFYNYLKNFGISTLNMPPSHYGLSLILGGAETTLWDISAAYASLGRALIDQPACRLTLKRSVNKGVDRDHEMELMPNLNIDKGAVWQTFEVLKEVNRPEEIDWKTVISMYPIAWKTGTSYGFRDAWAVGVNPNYVVGVWVGNASGEGKPELIGARTAGPILFDVFNLLPASKRWFEIPLNSFVEAEVCSLSGMIKGRHCNTVDTMLLLPNGLRSETCKYHHLVTLTPDKKFRSYKNNLNTVTEPWFTLPPVWEWYYKQYHPEYKPLPQYFKGEFADGSSPMQFIYPQMNAVITIPKQMDGSLGYITAEIAHGDRSTTVFWHLDDNYLSQTEVFHQVSIRPAKGRHTLTAVDSNGNSVSVSFFIN